MKGKKYEYPKTQILLVEALKWMQKRTEIVKIWTSEILKPKIMSNKKEKQQIQNSEHNIIAFKSEKIWIPQNSNITRWSSKIEEKKKRNS